MAAPSKLLYYQGRLTNSNAQPLANGNYAMTFRIYLQQAPGGTIQWSEVHDGVGGNPALVAVTNGFFSVVLGTVTSIGGLTFDADYYLEVQLQSNSPFSPRDRLTTSAYTIRAIDANTTVNSQACSADATCEVTALSATGSATVTGDVTTTEYNLRNRTGAATWSAVGDTLADDWLRLNRNSSFGGLAFYQTVAIPSGGGLAVGSWDRPTQGIRVLNSGERVEIGGSITGETGSPSIELKDTDADGLTPYIDWSNDGAADYDMRLRLTGDDTLAIEGGNLVGNLTGTADNALACTGDGTCEMTDGSATGYLYSDRWCDSAYDVCMNPGSARLDMRDKANTIFRGLQMGQLYIPDMYINGDGTNWYSDGADDLGTSGNPFGDFYATRIFQKYGDWAAIGDGGVGIVNDDTAGSTTYGALMIVGNNSAGGNRRVKIWDKLDVMGVFNEVNAGTPETLGLCEQMSFDGGGGDTVCPSGYAVVGAWIGNRGFNSYGCGPGTGCCGGGNCTGTMYCCQKFN